VGNNKIYNGCNIDTRYNRYTFDSDTQKINNEHNLSHINILLYYRYFVKIKETSTIDAHSCQDEITSCFDTLQMLQTCASSSLYWPPVSDEHKFLKNTLFLVIITV